MNRRTFLLAVVASWLGPWFSQALAKAPAMPEATRRLFEAIVLDEVTAPHEILGRRRK